MQPRFLIINCPSDYFFSVPMGTFGICDYLSKRGFPAKILNLALYEKKGLDGVLRHYLDSFQPTHNCCRMGSFGSLCHLTRLL